jgi:hypothetical protein
MEWLVASLVVSLVLTVLVNAAIRMWPGAASRGIERLTDWTERQDGTEVGRGSGPVRVIFPWKAMLVASIVLTVGLNVVLRLM